MQGTTRPLGRRTRVISVDDMGPVPTIEVPPAEELNAIPHGGPSPIEAIGVMPIASVKSPRPLEGASSDRERKDEVNTPLNKEADGVRRKAESAPETKKEERSVLRRSLLPTLLVLTSLLAAGSLLMGVLVYRHVRRPPKPEGETVVQTIVEPLTAAPDMTMSAVMQTLKQGRSSVTLIAEGMETDTLLLADTSDNTVITMGVGSNGTTKTVTFLVGSMSLSELPIVDADIGNIDLIVMQDENRIYRWRLETLTDGKVHTPDTVYTAVGR